MDRQVIRYSLEFSSQVAQLLTEFWPDPALNRAYFSWLHEENPYSDSALVYLLVERGRILGMRGFHAARWEIAGTGEVFDAPCACMFVLSKEARGQGLSQMIMDAALAGLTDAGFRHVLSFSATPIPYTSQLRHGWRLVGNYRTIRRERPGFVGGLDDATGGVLRLRRIERYVKRRLPLSARDPFARFDAKLPVRCGAAIFSAGPPDAHAMSALAGRTGKPGRIRHLRDPAYFEWRFRNPRTTYRTITLCDEALRGFLVLRAKPGSPEAVGIVDWEAADDETLSEMIRTVAELGGFPSLSIWSAPLPESVLQDLGRAGFRPIDETRGVPGYLPGLQIRSLEKEGSDTSRRFGTARMDDLSHWDLRPAYSDKY